MRILCINQFFWPDAAPTAVLLEDVVSKMAADGHDMTVICGDNPYRMAGERRPVPPARIRRMRIPRLPRGRFGRAASDLIFLLLAAARSLLSRRADVVVTLSTPPFIGLIGTLLSITGRSRHYVWEMDLYPEIVADLGYFSPASLVYRSMRWVARLIRGHADGVLVLGDCMRRRMLAAGVPPDRLHVVENWVDGRIISAREPVRAPVLEILYSGNAGLAHDLETVAAAMAKLREDARFRFRFFGHGPRMRELVDFCRARDIENVEFAGFQPREEFDRALARCHIGLVTQRNACTGSVVPSKVYGILAAARPVLFIGPADATPAQVIQRHECGWHIECGDVDGLADLLWRLAEEPSLLHSAGRNARRAFLEYYDMPKGVDRFVQALGLQGSAAG